MNTDGVHDALKGFRTPDLKLTKLALYHWAMSAICWERGSNPRVHSTDDLKSSSLDHSDISAS